LRYFPESIVFAVQVGVPMFRKSLSLLLVVPLLLPPGVCVCDCAASKCAAAGGDEQAAPDLHDGEDHDVCCDCCHPPAKKGHVCDRPAPADHPFRHAPGCPAAVGEQWKIKPTHPTVLPTADRAGLAPVPDTVPQASESGFRSRHAAPGQPLFLTLLTLRI
jgi:hypothetical protein